MTNERWKKLEERALWLLGHAEQASHRETLEGTVPVLRLWKHRCNGLYASWTILTPLPEDQARRPLAREIVWDRPLDLRGEASQVARMKRRQPARPSVRIRDIELATSELQPHLEWAARLTPGLPASASPEAGKDVTGIEGYRSMTHLRCEWNGEGPPEWMESKAHFDSLLRFLEDRFRERETSR